MLLSRDSKLTGADASTLINALMNASPEQKMKPASDSTSEHLASNYSSFIKRVGELVDGVNLKRTEVLRHKQHQRERELTRIHSQSTFELGNDYNQVK